MSKRYITHNVYLESADFHILVIEFPEEDINDKLALLATEKGLIYQHFYEDFVIGTCMANAGSFFFHIRKRPELLVKFADIRKEALSLVYKHSPGFLPTNIVANQNNVLKTKDSLTKDSILRPLIENALWDKEPPLSNFGPAIITGAPKKDDNPFSDSNESGDPPELPEGPENPFSDTSSNGEIDVPYELVGHKWDKIGLYINVRKYEEEPDILVSLLGGTPFTTTGGYHLLVVERCIEDWEDVLAILDQMGVGKKINPSRLILEIYEIALKYNPFLRLEDIDLPSIRKQYKQQNRSKVRNNKRMSAAGQEDKSLPTKKKKFFKDVPKEVLLGLSDAMRKHVVGQDDAITTVVDAVQRASVGLKREHEPLGTFLFTGNTGVGKTEMSKALADCLDAHLVRVDCQEYQQPHEAAKLTGCFVPGTPILLGDGTVSDIEDVRVGETIVSHTGYRRKVLETFEYDYKGSLVELKSVGSNLPIRVTPNHEIGIIKSNKCKLRGREHVVCKPTCFRTQHVVQTCSTHLFDSYQLEWLPAKDVQVGDIVAYPRYKSDQEPIQRLDLVEILSEYGFKFDDKYIWTRDDSRSHIIPRFIPIDKDFMHLAGYYVAEGGKNWKTKRGINFSFHYDEDQYQEEVVSLIQKIFGISMEFSRPLDEEKLGKKRKRGYVHSRIISCLFTKLFGENTWKKRLPEWFMDLPANLIQAFLTTAIFGDGTTAVSRRVSYKTVSFNLHSQMKLLFSKLGYIVQTMKSDPKKETEQPSYNLLIGGDQIVRMSEEFPDLEIDLGEFKNSNIQRMSWVDDDYIYIQIKEKNIIEYDGKIHDIRIDQDTSYIVHNFFVHNSPPGYVGYDDGGHLVKEISKYPFSIILFDEIEKAHNTFHERVLQVIDDGILTDNKGKKVSFKDCLIIMTSNIGVKEVSGLNKAVGFGDIHDSGHDKTTQARLKALKKKFKPEFLNRIDEIVNFRQLEKKDYMHILDILLNEVKEQIRVSQGILLGFNVGAKNFILDHGIDKKFGARPMRRSVKKYLNTELARAILKGDVEEGSKINVNLKPEKDGLIFRTLKKGKKSND